jgi:glycosyltransferase involved in cell wall biosynthesis
MAGAAVSVRLVHITTVPLALRFLRGQPAYLREQGFEVAAISSPGEELRAFAESEGVPVTAIEMPRRITPHRDVVALWKLARELRRQQPAIVHAHTPKGGLLGMLGALLARVPVRIYHLRGLPYMTATGRRRQLLMATERVSCRVAHRVICVSHSLREVAIRDGICPPEKITVLAGGSGQGVDAMGRFNPERFPADYRDGLRAELGIAAGARVIGYVGRIVRDKGIHELAAAWSELRARYPDLHLVLAGPLEPQDPIDPGVLRSLRDDARVHLTGWAADTSEVYPAFDVVALPTYREGFPNVPLEAGAMRLPVVATRIPGCVDAVIDGVTGTLVPPRDAVALEAALARYLGDAELRRRHGKAGREQVLREFRPEVIREALLREYESLVRGRINR